jgi:hypothetical protein
MFSFWKKRAFTARVGDTAAFPYPLSPCPPIAVFGKDTPFLDTVKTVAAPLRALHEIDAKLWHPEYPIVVLSSADDGLMSEDDRDWIWMKFRVPSFEYLLDQDGRIVAKECEAHEGLHFDTDKLEGVILNDACPCGKPGPRLLTLDAIIEKSVAGSTLTQEWRNWQTHQT